MNKLRDDALEEAASICSQLAEDAGCGRGAKARVYYALLRAAEAIRARKAPLERTAKP